MHWCLKIPIPAKETFVLTALKAAKSVYVLVISTSIIESIATLLAKMVVGILAMKYI